MPEILLNYSPMNLGLKFFKSEVSELKIGPKLSFNWFLNLFRPLNLARKKIEIYTDGSHKGRWGSWAYVIVSNNKVVHENSGRQRKTNSHRMEFQAAIEALRSLPHNSRATLYADSRVLINTFTKTNNRTPVNSDQTDILEELQLQHNITWQWIRAHSGISYNERCDELCILARTISS